MQLRWLTIIIVGVSSGIILFAVSWVILSERDKSANEAKGVQQAKGDKPDPSKEKDVAKEAEKAREELSKQEERRALAKARLQAILSLKAETSETLTTLEQEVTVWETRIPAIMKSVDGQKIAANPARAEQFAGVVEKDRVSKTRVKELRDRLETLIAPIERAILDANATYFASETIVGEIQKIGSEARTKLRDLREIKAVLDTLQADSALTPPGDRTLEKVISDMNAERARRRGQLIAKARAEEHEIESKRLAAAEAKAEQDLANARLELLKAKTDAERQGVDLQTEDTKRKTQDAVQAEKKRVEKAKREAKFDAAYPGMKGYLVPITSAGYAQFRGNSLEMTVTKGPMSLASLLGNTKKGKNETGYFARNISNYKNDRPQGGFPHYSTGGAGQTSQNFEIWFGVQDFIAEFGDIMVERKLLLP